MKPIIIYGSKSYSSLIKLLIKDCNRECLGVIDDFCTGNNILGDFNKVRSKYHSDNVEIALGIGYSNLSKRKETIHNIEKYFNMATLIHPQAYVAEGAIIGEGSVIMAGAHVDYNVNLGKGVVCWPKTVINHDSIIGDNTFISPGAIICGFVSVGESCFIGANSTIVDHTNIKMESFIKANSLIVNRENGVL